MGYENIALTHEHVREGLHLGAARHAGALEVGSPHHEGGTDDSIEQGPGARVHKLVLRAHSKGRRGLLGWCEGTSCDPDTCELQGLVIRVYRFDMF